MSKYVTGTKQVLKAVAASEAVLVYIAQDTEPYLLDKISSACTQSGVRVEWVKTKTELGRQCKIAVGAAAAAIIKD